MKFVARKPGAFQLSNEQWNAIRKHGGLPDRARASIEDALTHYRELLAFWTNNYPTTPTRKLHRVAKLADDLLTLLVGKDAKLRARLRCFDECHFSPGAMPEEKLLSILGPIYTPRHKVVWALGHSLSRRNKKNRASVPRAATTDSDGSVVFQMPGGLGQIYASTADGLSLLGQICWNIERLRLCAEDSASIARPGAPKGAHLSAKCSEDLVRSLDEILFAYTGKLISRSYKRADLRRCADLCFRAVNSKIGSGSIDKAIQAHVSERLRTSKALDRLSGSTANPLPLSRLLFLAMDEMEQRLSETPPRVTKLRDSKRA